MLSRTLGRAGPVSVLSLGGGGIGGVYGAVDRDEARATVRAAVDAGITLLDLAPSYGPGEASPQAELVVAEAFGRRLPEHVRVSSKVAIEDPAPAAAVRSAMRASLHATLERLGRDHLDVCILHCYVRPAGTAPLPNTIAVDVAADVVRPEFERLVDEGLIRAWGLTGTAVPEAVCALLEDDPPPDAVQCAANAIDALGNMWPEGLAGEPDGDRILRTAAARGVGVMGIRALAAGALSERLDRDVPASDPSARDFARADGFRALAREWGIAPATLAHRYALSLPDVATVVIGAKTRGELADCLAAEAAGPLSAEQMQQIRGSVMDRLVETIEVVPSESAFFRDDQAAIRAGAARNGFLYAGAPRTPGFAGIREPGRALTILLRLDDGHVVTGDCVEVQYAGAGGRDAPLDAARGAELVATVAAPALAGRAVGDFRALSGALRPLGLPAWLRYGLSQALLRAAAHARVQPMAQVVCEQWELPRPTTLVPVLAQSGEAPREAADRMILKRVDALPHGLINNVEMRLGVRGELLEDLVVWLRDRVLELAGEKAYRPVLQFDVYGTIGIAFGTTSRMAEYLERLAAAARPFALRIEHPVDAGGRAAQIEALGALRGELRSRGCAVELIADEWCNTIDDVEAFAAAGCVDMIQVKTPDLGGLDETVDALLACKRNGIKAYCGGTCNETVGSAEATAHVALACASDLTLAKPGMGVDEGLSVTRNAMRVALARMA